MLLPLGSELIIQYCTRKEGGFCSFVPKLEGEKLTALRIMGDVVMLFSIEGVEQREQ